MSAQTLPWRVVPSGVLRKALGTGRAGLMVERNARVYRRGWLVLVSGFFEPLFYLLSVGVGVARLVGDVEGPSGRLISYTAFVAPAMLASSAMNGAIYDATFNIFFKLKYAKTYDSVLATPMTPGDVAAGEIAWALLRGGVYSTAFLVVMTLMGLVSSWWGLLVLPAALLIGFCFAAAGMAATTWMRSWQDFEFVTLATLPMFLFSATFYPLSTYAEPLRTLVQLSPLYHAAALVRELTTGTVAWSSLAHVGYLVALGLLGSVLAALRLERLLLR
jgi:lipooligosaccharide transport system permease protein